MWPRTEFDPGHFTASGFVLSPDQKSVLLILHGKLDRWLQPGGHLESEDISIVDAARREAREETGIGELRLLGSTLMRIDAHQIPRHGDEPPHVHIDLGVGFHAGSPELGPIDEVIDARWVPLDELQAFDVDAALMDGARAVRHAAG